ncbi:hypothetical protein DFO73_12243 [Cytobacillus oceanisediminis]|uniref:Uncharacterized protein n=1 Tax=Cytobacillus oceanisediminis TaxID=665099 RepID=A0A2V2ZGR2_9BACI|nr:hypothetical protein DFO73_12243 [Cytobacillus oceanisediminis]
MMKNENEQAGTKSGLLKKKKKKGCGCGKKSKKK